MKRYRFYLFLGVFLSALAIAPILYPKWMEIKRERLINQTIIKARQLPGKSLTGVLPEVSWRENELVVLYTGDTQSYIEPCGCYQGQSGGVARRATLIEKLRNKKANLLVLDAGGIFDGETTLDQLRSEVYLKTMDVMGYDAATIAEAELKFGLAFLKDQIRKINFSFVATNLQFIDDDLVAKDGYVIKKYGKIQVAILGLSSAGKNSLNPTVRSLDPIASLQKLRTQLNDKVNLTIVLSSLPPEENRKIALQVPDIDVIISSYEGKPEMINGTLLLYSTSHGKTVGMLKLMFNDKSQVIDRKIEQIIMLEDIPDQPQVRKLLTDFYHQVASDPSLQRATKLLFASEKLEQDKENGYVGGEACRTCHEEEYKQWETTSHGMAFNTLLKVEKHFYPECVSCHTTGFGYKTGYKIDQPKEYLKGVQCETCHGPGQKHISSPSKENIRRKVEVGLCAQCHNQEHHPGFMKVANLLVPEVDHSQEPFNLRQMLAKKITGTTKPQLELFAMSFCPAGISAEKQLIPILRELGGKVDFTLRFIADEKDSSIKRNPEYEFESLHGQAEVEENIRQLVIAKYYPQKLFDYLLCRVDNIKESWKDCANQLKLDVQKIERITKSLEGREMFRENIKKSQELKILASPTLLLDGQIFSSQIFAKGFVRSCGP